MPAFEFTYYFESCQRPGEDVPAGAIVPGVGQLSVMGAGCVNMSWTETWYRDYAAATSIETALADAGNTTSVDAYLRWRLPLLPDIYHCPWVRVSTTPLPGRRALAKFRAVNEDGLWEGLAAQTQCCILVNFTAVVAVAGPPAGEETHYRRFLIRGLPAAVIQGNLYRPTPAYGVLLEEFCQYITRRTNPLAVPPTVVTPMRIRYVNSDAAVALGGLGVATTNNRLLEITQPTVPLTVGQRVQLRGVVLPQGGNRNWRVVGTTAAVGDQPARAILGISRKPLAGAWNNTGTVRVITYGYAPATNYQVMGLRNKKTGSRPLNPLRGRRRAG